MRNNFVYLNDKNFLNELFSQKVKNHYAKISLLDFNTEKLYKEFEGRVTAGTVTLSATSLVRRTCSLTIIAAEDGSTDFDNLDSDISINKKFQLMVGYENNLSNYKKYGDIIWFPQGIFIFQKVSITRNKSGVTISVTGQDKMCLLNGEIAGELQANTTFHERYTYKDDGSILSEDVSIFQIIQEAVNHLGGESLPNIVINDVSEDVKQAVQYNGTKKLYYGYNKNLGRNTLTFNKSDLSTTLKTFTAGDVVGYKYTNFTYPGELVMNAGSNVANVLKKITDVLSNHEFFYDRDGIFHFQEIKNYLNTSYTPLKDLTNENYIVDFSESSKVTYVFDDSELVISYSNNPDYKNIKNDICVWGSKKTDNDSNLAIFYHIAIDKKPVIQSHNIILYKDDNGKVLVKPESAKEKGDNPVTSVIPADWRYELYLQGLENAVLGLANHNYYSELTSYFPEIYDFENNCFYDFVDKNPEDLVYWLELIDPSEEDSVGQFSISNIGKRTKALTDTDINILYEKDIPDIVVLNKDEIEIGKTVELELNGQDYYLVDSDIYSLFSAASTPTTAYSKARDMLSQYTNYNESISITCMPLFFLEPNNRITVNNKKAQISGDYIIKTINLPLAANGQMTITATKATTRL